MADKQDIFSELAEKKRSMDQARSALTETPSPIPDLPKAPPPQMNVDKVNPKAKYGTRKGEVRIPVDQMIKPLASFKEGTDYVPKTGLYKLHEGEAVKTKEENMADVYAHVRGAQKRNPPRKKSSVWRSRSLTMANIL